ncbi:hypothetical protein [Streptomyces sp. NPDC048191]|uniref:hypothetical protein n=1 Tax=Streptomyces sp. NPDC048191 TaxID=3155484 RepID=UPI0033CA31E1
MRIRASVAVADGYHRFSFAGNSTTSAVSAAGDFVDVQWTPGASAGNSWLQSYNHSIASPV